MGTITPRQNRDGSTSYKAQVRVRQGGKVVHQETKTFDRKQVASAWVKKRDSELATDAGLKKALADDPTLKEVITQYMSEVKRAMSVSKTNVLKMIKAHEFAGTVCSKVDSQALVKFTQDLGVAPATADNYLSHLAAVVRIARPAWGYPLDQQAMDDARIVLKRMGAIARSNQRDRRPTVQEMDDLMDYFSKSKSTRNDTVPMLAICLMTMFSLRRAIEICNIVWSDLDVDGCRIMVRDLKHPEAKIGNDTWCELTPEALRVIQAQPKVPGEPRIFPYAPKSCSMAFTSAVQVKGIPDLVMNDLRHEGASRLSEMGWTVQRVATVSGHRSWNTLKRYTHVRQTGDKWAGWKWLDIVAPPGDQK